MANPKLIIQTLQKKQVVEITKENILSEKIFPKGSLPPEFKCPSSQRLLYLIQRVETLSKKMGLTKKVELYTSPKMLSTGALGSPSSSLSRPSIFLIDAAMINLPDAELDVVIAHELGHIKHNDTLKQLVFHSVALIVDAIACVLLSPLSVFALEPLISISKHYLLGRTMEKNADSTAIKTLNSKQGAIDLFTRFLKNSLDFKKASYDEALALLDRRRLATPEKKEKWGLEKVMQKQAAITDSGNNKKDLDHPPLTTRLDMAKNFRINPLPA